MNDFKQTFDKELEALRQSRDELKLQVHLAKAEARDEWRKLEGQWQRIEDEIKRFRAESKKPLSEIGGAARELAKDLKAGYERLRSRL